MELLAPDMGVEFLHGGNGRDLNGSVIEVGNIPGVAVHKDINGAKRQPPKTA